MEGSEVDTGSRERDSTKEWLLPAEAAPPLLGDLEARIEEAVTIARASEEAVRVIGARAEAIGAQAVDAATQARRAADLAGRASEAALAAATAPAAAATPPLVASSPLEDAWLRGFTDRADRVMARLRAVERRPAPARG
jgi:hypothetical protein